MAYGGLNKEIAAELGGNPVSKHQIQPEYGDEQRLTRDGTAEDFVPVGSSTVPLGVTTLSKVTCKTQICVFRKTWFLCKYHINCLLRVNETRAMVRFPNP